MCEQARLALEGRPSEESFWPNLAALRLGEDNTTMKLPPRLAIGVGPVNTSPAAARWLIDAGVGVFRAGVWASGGSFGYYLESRTTQRLTYMSRSEDKIG